MNSPFKFLDSYTRDDRAIFFGRDREIEELYQKVFESKILLVYGVSGTGKSSLIHCGLASKFSESDWLPVNVRRGRDINESLRSAVERGLQPATGNQLPATSNQLPATKVVPIKKLLKNLYLDHFKPVFLIFDQFEELFIFGSRQEKEEFVKSVKTIVESDLQVRFMFVIREEYLAGITEFERQIPTVLSNRVRIEKMTRVNAQQAIEGPCKYAGIEVEQGFAEQLLDKLTPEGTDVELTYLQVFLDKIFKLSVADNTGQTPKFNLSLLQQTGDVKDLLGSFLEEQIGQLPDPDSALVVLKSFVSSKGTKRQVTEEDVLDYSRTLGKNISIESLRDLILRFVSLRILRDKDESGRYELRHDALASKIYEKITLVEKELLEVRQFIENAYDNYKRRKVMLSASDLSYIAPYEDKMYLGEALSNFVSDSKYEQQRARRRKRNLATAAVIALLVIMTGFTWWAMRERSKADEQRIEAEKQKNEALAANQKAIQANKNALDAKDKAELAKTEALNEKQRAEQSAVFSLQMKKQAELSRNDAINAKNIAVLELYSSMKKSLATELPKMNVIYIGIDNPLFVSASGINPDKFIIKIIEGVGDIRYHSDKDIDDKFDTPEYTLRTNTIKNMIINIKGITNKGDTIDFGNRQFRVRRVPDPVPKVADMMGGTIKKSKLLNEDSIYVDLPGFVYDLHFTITSFTLSTVVKGYVYSGSSSNNKYTKEQKDIISKADVNSKVYFEDIKAKGPDGTVRNLGSLAFKIIPEMSLDEIEAIFDSLKSSSQWDKYLNLAVTYRENNYNDSAYSYQVANNVYLHTNDTIYLKAAKELIESVIKINDMIHVKATQWRYLELYALIRYKLGDLNNAKQLERGVRLLKNMDMKNDSSIIEMKMGK